MPEFWEFFSLLCIFWISQSGIWAIQDPICFDLLGKSLRYRTLCRIDPYIGIWRKNQNHNFYSINHLRMLICINFPQ